MKQFHRPLLMLLLSGSFSRCMCMLAMKCGTSSISSSGRSAVSDLHRCTEPGGVNEHERGGPVASNSILNLSRRRVLTMLSTAAVPLTAGPSPARASSVSSSGTELPAGLLESRVLENVLSPPPYGMEGPDIYYPSWFSGTWKVYSECTDVIAPCGVALFGGNRTFEAALADKGPSKALDYESRFLPSLDATAIADREFNVKNIARVAMGINSVVDIPLSTPNKFSCLLAPEGAPSMLRVDLLVLNRRQENGDATHFDCSEVVREILSPLDSSMPTRSNPLLKEVETTSLYTLQPNGDITCRQRSATFLLPSQQDPLALQMWQAAQGRPIDVRFYEVKYTRKQSK